MQDLVQLKKAAFAQCKNAIQSRVQTLQSVLQSLEESRNNESKSSVGDKYETARTMLQLEEEKNKTQLAEALAAQRIVDAIQVEQVKNQVENGSLVVTNAGTYFIAIAVGKMAIDGNLVYGISLDAPIGQLMKYKKVRDICNFNGKLIKIEAIV
ncbi:MAG: 3-oxoacyl-ACP synthase [Saprospiraceae bacterium]